MSKGVKKALSVDHKLLPALAETATRLAAEAGVANMIAVPAKRTIQWRVKFNSDVRKGNAPKRKYQGYFDSFGVSKNVAGKRFAAVGVDYTALIVKAYAENGLDYNAEPQEKDGRTTEPKQPKAVVAKKPKAAKAKPVEGDVTPAADTVSNADVDALLATAAA